MHLSKLYWLQSKKQQCIEYSEKALQKYNDLPNNKTLFLPEKRNLHILLGNCFYYETQKSMIHYKLAANLGL